MFLACGVSGAAVDFLIALRLFALLRLFFAQQMTVRQKAAPTLTCQGTW